MDATLSWVSYFLRDLMPTLEQQWYYFNYAAKNEAPPAQWQQIGLFKNKLNLIHKSRKSAQSCIEIHFHKFRKPVEVARTVAVVLLSLQKLRHPEAFSVILWLSSHSVWTEAQRVTRMQRIVYRHYENYFIFLTDVFLRIHSIHTFSKKSHRNSLPHRKVKMIKTIPLTVKSWFNIIKAYGILNSCKKQYYTIYYHENVPNIHCQNKKSELGKFVKLCPRETHI